MTGAPFVSFLSDYGTADEFVGVCHAVMLRIEPRLRIVDVTHDLPAHDVRAGALALARSAQYLPPGVVLAVVDPGVGSERRAVAIETEAGHFVGPDNGLLASAVAMVGGATRAVELTNPDYQLPAPGPTFDGRDVFAPAAAHLSAGVRLEELGDAVDPYTLQPGILPVSYEENGVLYGEVLWADRFGNLQLNLDPAELDGAGLPVGSQVEVRYDDQRRIVRRVTTFADARDGELVLLVDSYGLVALSVNRGSAADETGLRAAQSLGLSGPAATS